MKTRLITAFVAVVVFFTIIYVLPPVVAVVAFRLLCAIAAYEMLGATGALKRHPLLWVSCVFAAVVPLLTVYGGAQALLAGVFGYVCVSLGWAVFDYKRLGFSQVAEGFFGAFAIPFLLSAALRNASLPAECPAFRGSPRFCAQRPLPSIMMATWRGILFRSISLSAFCFFFPNQATCTTPFA